MNTWKIDNQDFYRLGIIDSLPKHEGKTIQLLTKDELYLLQATHPDKILITIFGEEKMAKDVDDDTRGGFIGAGHVIK